MSFVDLDKVFQDFFNVFWRRGPGPLLRVIWSLYNQTKSLVCIADNKLIMFQVHVGLQQECHSIPNSVNGF